MDSALAVQREQLQNRYRPRGSFRISCQGHDQHFGLSFTIQLQCILTLWVVHVILLLRTGWCLYRELYGVHDPSELQYRAVLKAIYIQQSPMSPFGFSVLSLQFGLNGEIPGYRHPDTISSLVQRDFKKHKWGYVAFTQRYNFVDIFICAAMNC